MDDIRREENDRPYRDSRTALDPPGVDGGRPLAVAGAPVLLARRVAGAVRTCVPARHGQGGYREPAEPGAEEHIVRGED